MAGQQDRLEKAGTVRGFIDVMSGGKFEHPGLAELVDHECPGDRLCVTKLDRLGRSLKELLETVEELQKQGIHLVSLEEKIDIDSVAGEMVFHVFGAVAHFERHLIRVDAACMPRVLSAIRTELHPAPVGGVAHDRFEYRVRDHLGE